MELKYRPEIDGLRAFAVIPVILFHAGFQLFGGGFIGVDVFFVISGYLITSIIINDIEAGTFSFWTFYERRARRILPALFFVTFCCIPFAVLWIIPSELEKFSDTLISVILFVSNINLLQQSGYFDTAGELKPLLHTWSLAVEEQYYIIFPIALTLLWRLGRRYVVWALGFIALVSLVGSEYGSRYFPLANFYLLPTRAWELIAGALCSFAIIKPNIWRDNLLSIAGVIAIAVSIFAYDETVSFPSIYALMPVLGACAILLFAREGTLTCYFLSIKPIVGIGLISYSAYLWHQPLFAFARIRSLTEPSIQLMMLLAAASIALAYFSWRFIERPARRIGTYPFPNRRTIMISLSMFASLIVAFGITGKTAKGFPYRAQIPLASSAEFNFPNVKNGYCFYSINNLKDLEIGANGVKCKLGAEANSKSVLLFGDSLAGHWEPFWDKVGKEIGFSVHSVTTNFCFPSITDNFTTSKDRRSFEQCIFNRNFVQTHLAEYDVVVIAGAWHNVEAMSYFQDVISFVIYILDKTQANIIIMPSPPSVTNNSIDRSLFTGHVMLLSDKKKQDLINKFQARMKTLASSNTRIKLLEADMLFGNYFNSNGMLTIDNLPYGLDGAHISIYGSLSSAQHVLSDNRIREDLAHFMLKMKH